MEQAPLWTNTFFESHHDRLARVLGGGPLAGLPVAVSRGLQIPPGAILPLQAYRRYGNALPDYLHFVQSVSSQDCCQGCFTDHTQHLQGCIHESDITSDQELGVLRYITFLRP